MDNLIFTGGFAWWVIFLFAVGATVLLFRQLADLQARLNRRRAAVLTLLRAGVYLCLVLFLLGPTWVQKNITRVRRPLILLVDASESMRLPVTPDGKSELSRIQAVRKTLLEGKRPWLERLAQEFDLRLYQFHSELNPLSAASISDLGAQGKGTRLVEAMQQARRDTQGAAGLVLLSDGITHGTTSPGGPHPFPLPVLAVAVGETQGFIDLAITGLRVPVLAFRGRELKVDFTLKAYGLAGKRIPLYFKRRRKLISTRPVTIDRDLFEQHMTLTYTPDQIGPQSFALSLPPQPKEQIVQNNQKDFKIEVRRDKLRVLTLSGSPSWNYRFLRFALKEDPFIDLVSFVFLRTPTDLVDVPENQLSLIPFPIDEIFVNELNNFDIIFLDDFSHRSYFNSLYLERVRDFVRDGGGLAMLGGRRAFDSGGYLDTPLKDLLPVELDGKGSYATGARLRPVLSSSGKSHPITRIFSEPETNQQAWDKMPPLTTLNRVRQAKGEVLLSVSSNGADLPLLTVGKFGQGRTLAFLSDDLWKWNFVAAGEKVGSQVHQKLIRQAVRWLAQEPSFDQVQILPLSGSKVPGEKIEFRIKVLKDDFTPATQGELLLRVEGPDGERMPLDAVPEDAPGEYRAEFVPLKEGPYVLHAGARLAGRSLGENQESFLVSLSYEEMEDGRPRLEFLHKIAEQSGGDLISVSQWNEESWDRFGAKLEARNPSRTVERRELPLWSIPWITLLILVLLGCEWWYRRSWGLI